MEKNQSKVIIKNGVMRITTRTGEGYVLPAPAGVSDLEIIPDANDPNPMRIDNVKVEPPCKYVPVNDV